MLLFLLGGCLIDSVQLLSTITLTTNQDIVTMYNGTINDDFQVKSNSFDCSAFVYSYAQTTQEYRNNQPVQLTLNGVVADTPITVSTVYNHFTPELLLNICGAPSCDPFLYHNCPGDLDSENYFDIVQINVQGVGTFSYYLSCDEEFTPYYFEWGQLIITCCATIIIIVATVFARLESFNGSGIEYGFRAVFLIAFLVLAVGMLTLYAPSVASPMLDVISWVVGTVAVGVVTLQILFRFVRHTPLNNSCQMGPIPVRYVDVISLLVGLGFMMTWWFTGKNWIVSDVICTCIIISFIKVFKYTSLRVALFSYFLIVSLYSIGAILAAVSNHETAEVYFLFQFNNPFQFQMPVITPTYRINCAWIAFTSIAFTGLLVAYLHRFDMSRATNIYLISSVIAYFFGSIIWNVVSSFSRHPIPFDAVCPPFVLLTISFMAFNRKELRTIWEGTFYDQEFFHKEDIQKLGERLSIELPQVDLLRGSVPNEAYLSKKGLEEFRQNVDYNLKAYLIPDQNV